MKQANLKFKRKLKIFAGLILMISLFICASVLTESAGIGFAIATVPVLAWIKEGQFIELSQKEIDKLNEEDYEKYRVAAKGAQEEAFDKRVMNLIKNLASKDDLTDFKKEIEGKNFAEKLEQYDKVIEKLQATIETKKGDNETGYETFKELFKEVRKGIDFNIKATAIRATVDSSTMAYRLEGIARVAGPKFVMSELFSVISVPENNNGTIRYIDWDATSITRSAAAIAEAAVYPESTADWKEYTLVLEKVGDTIPVSEEFLSDVNFAQGELTWFLMNNVMRAENTYLYSGTGATPQISGIYTRVTAFNAAAYAGATTTTPDLIDLIDVLSNEIADGKDGKYETSFCLVPHADYLELLLEKDTTGRRIRDKVEIDNNPINIIPSSFVTANTLVTGDGDFAKVYQNEAYNMTIGRGGDDFTYDLMTLKARRRMALLIREADKDGFLKVTDIDAAIVAITT